MIRLTEAGLQTPAGLVPGLCRCLTMVPLRTHPLKNTVKTHIYEIHMCGSGSGSGCEASMGQTLNPKLPAA